MRHQSFQQEAVLLFFICQHGAQLDLYQKRLDPEPERQF